MRRWKPVPTAGKLAASASQERMDKVAMWFAKQDAVVVRPRARPTTPSEVGSQASRHSSLSRPVTASSVNNFFQEQQAPPPPQRDRGAEKAKLKSSTFVQSASNALNSRFSDMFKAFQYVDLDRSGSLNKKELVRALDLWNIPLDDEKLDELIAACDDNGDGDVDYKEFVDVLARDTVAIAAMGKRDMQASEAMGVVDLDPEFLGHKKIKNVRASINDAYM